MAATKQCLASMARPSVSSSLRPASTFSPRFPVPSTTQTRWKSAGTSMMQAREKEKEKLKKKKKQVKFKEYKYAVPTGKDEQFSLCDAMRYLRAAEVGRPPKSVTYEVALRIRTFKNGPICRNRVRFPHPVKNDTRIAVICAENSSAMNEARQLGAVAYGQDSLFALIKAQPNNLPFNRLICHPDSVPALNKAGVGRILGPKGLMPSIKTNTVSKSIKSLIQDMGGSEPYREKIGVVRLAIGNILFTPKQLAANVKALVESVKSDIAQIEERGGISKDLIEVVLSSTNGPGFPLNGGFTPTDETLDPAALATAM